MADRKGKCPMVRIAILEDDAQDLASLEKCLQQYETEQQKSFSLHSFSDPAVFLEGNISDYDLIFLDIDLPTMTGMDLARQIRQRDSLVTLVFVTNLEKYAVNGYEVDALLPCCAERYAVSQPASPGKSSSRQLAASRG